MLVTADRWRGLALRRLAVAGIADIQRVAVAGGIKKDVAQDRAAIVDGDAAGGAGGKVDGVGNGTGHRPGCGNQMRG